MPSSNMDIWYDLTEASHILGVSRRTLERRIKNGILESKVVDGRRYVKIDTLEQLSSARASLINQLRSEIEHLHDEIKYLHQRLEKSEASRERCEIIISQLTKN